MHVRSLAAVALLAAAAVPAAPVPALAHGSPTTPISRNSACAGNGTRRDTAACKAALKATGGFLGAYDNLRLANVESDRERIPDGRLCSGGLDAYRGLDLARDDFPSTAVASGQNLRIAYRGTIPHQGSFRLFLTRTGYDPTAKLAWSDLVKLDETKDPPLTGGSYRMSVELPERTGRHVLYVVWETSSTPDTYYSCSDLVFPEPVVTKAPEPAVTSPVTSPATVTTTRRVPSPMVPSSPVPSEKSPLLAATRTEDDGMTGLGHWLIGGAIGVAALVAAGAVLSRLRRLKSR